MKYSQPKFYHFNQDSFSLINHIIETIKIKNIQPQKVLDLGSGCGVIGIELFLRISDLEKVIFIEKQSEFKPFLYENLSKINFNENQVYFRDWKNLKLNNKFDLIVSNPPYFIKGKSRESLDIKRSICRSIDEVSITNMFRTAIAHMHKKSLFIICVKCLSDWEKVLLQFEQSLQYTIKHCEDELNILTLQLNI